VRSSRSRRRDTNEPDIVKALKAAGCSVTRLDGDGVPDLLVGLNGVTMLVEVKRPLGPRGGMHHHGHEGSRGDLTADQVKWWDAWRGEMPVVVRTDADVELLVGLMKAGA
jgi:hypothetical protein